MNTIRGTQDILDMRFFAALVNLAKTHLSLYNFLEVSTPILEPIELFKRSLGLHTDVVSKEMFTVSAAGDEQICLRPEATAPLMRAFLNEKGVLKTPWKIFSVGPMFRHERPQKGRFRQFNQISIEIIAGCSLSYDAALITMLDRFFQQTLKLDTFALLLNFLGCPADREIFKKKIHTFLEKHSALICATCQERKEKNILRIFDCKKETCQTLYRNAPLITDTLCAACNQEWQDLKNLLQALSISYSHVPTLVRGLDYYDKTVFEFVSGSLGAQNTFCGGGRYNHLAGVLADSEEYPSVGAAIGIERLLLMLENRKEEFILPYIRPLQVIIPLSNQQHTLALLLADALFAQRITTEVLLESSSLKSLMRKANNMGAQHVIFVGEQEQANGTVVIKNMITGAEKTIAQRDLCAYFSM